MNIEEFKEVTDEHINHVRELLNVIRSDLMHRAIFHDITKLKSPEIEIFIEYTSKLRDTTYNSDEYKGYLKEMEVALKHHYKNNRHHPEYFGGDHPIQKMTLIDLTEMLCDWKAATLRHADGDIFTSIEQNQKRFNFSDELKEILSNTAKHLELL